MSRVTQITAMVLGIVGIAQGARAEAITGVCPDGSIFIVQKRSSIPCRAAKEVAPDEVPPVRPDYLPRPYTWQLYKQRVDPNNPYNLLDSARELRALGAAPPPAPMVRTPQQGHGQGSLAYSPRGSSAPSPTPPGYAGTAQPSYGQPNGQGYGRPNGQGYGQPNGQGYGRPNGQGYGRPPGPPGRVDLGLSHDEVRDLFLIIEYAQRHAPANFVKETALGEPVLEIAVAHSAAFETRFHDAWRAAGGNGEARILMFSAVALREGDFSPNFTFVQGHESFHPQPGDHTQLGLLEGQAGQLAADDVLLGYVVLPVRMDLSQPMDVYWNDRRITTTLRP